LKTRPFDLKTPVSEIGLGCWQIGGDWGAISDAEARDILRAAHESGVTFFDTADVYGGGTSERRIGAWLREDKPKEVFVATKLGRRAPFAESLTPKAIRSFTEDSLRNLGVEALDLTQLHCVPTEFLEPGGEVFGTLRDLQAKGKIKNFGASVETVEQGLLCLQQPGIASLQIILNVFRQQPLDELLPEAQKLGVAVLVRLPLASGLLSGKFTASTTFAETDHRTYNRDGAAFHVGETFSGLPFETGVSLADELKPMVPQTLTMAQWAQRWCLDQPGVTCLLTGASRPEQARENAAVSALPALATEQREALKKFHDERVALNVRGAC
jgi:aryl-alcohol dehydrogenase-like predicted oxidoreductase